MISIGMEDYLNFTKNNPNADGSAQQAFVTSVTNRLQRDIDVSPLNLKLLEKLAGIYKYFNYVFFKHMFTYVTIMSTAAVVFIRS